VKEPGAVRQKLKEAAYRHLSKRLTRELRERAANCIHNRVVEHERLPGDRVGICGHPDREGEHVLPCDAELGCDRAKDCGLFKPRADKDTLKAEFKAWLANADLAEIAVEYPDLAALMWVLQDDVPNREVEIGDAEDWDAEDTEEEPPHIPVLIGEIVLFGLTEQDAEAARNEIDGMQLAIDTANRQYKERGEEINTLRQSLSGLRATLDEAEDARLELRGRMEDAEALADSRGRLLETAKGVETDLRGEVDALTSQGKNATEALVISQQETAELRQRIEEQSQANAQVQNDYTRVKVERDQLKAANQSMRLDLDTKTREHAHVSGQLEEAHRNLAEIRSGLKDIREELVPTVTTPWWRRWLGGLS
jgi:hypothetical protein